MREGRNEDRAQLPGSSSTNSAQLLLAHRSGCGKCGAIKVDHQIGLEPTLGEHIAVMVEVFEEVRRVLKPTGTLWLNYGDCYATSPNGRSAADTKAEGNDDRTFRDKPFSTIGPIYRGGAPSAKSTLRGNGHVGGGPKLKSMTPVAVERSGAFLKAKDLCMIPNRLAIALQEAGWYVRSEIIWHKPNPMPESTRDRPTSSHEKVWLLTKRERYFYDAAAIAERAADTSIARWNQNVAGQTGSDRQPGKTNGNMKAVGGMSRPQAQRAVELAEKAGLTDAHIAAIRSVGITDVGKARITQSGCGRNDADVQALADEAKEALGGYYREFLVSEMRNSRNVWTIGTASFSEAHFATFPPELAERCIKAGCPVGGHVLDIFGGAGTTGLVAAQLSRKATLIELNPEYAILARARIEAAFMGRDEGARHMSKQLGKDKAPFEPGSLFAGIEEKAG
jgi:DNA modification methylase